MRTLRNRSTVLLVLAALAATAGTPSAARADHDIGTPYTGTRPFQLDLHGGLAWYGFGVASGARFGIPLVHNGFVPSLDNAVYLNFGADFYFIDDAGCYFVGAGCARAYRPALGFPVTLHWEFYFNDMWSAFAELGAQIFFPPSVFANGTFDYNQHAGMWVIGAAGGSLHLGVLSITLRVGNPYVAIGVTFEIG